MNAEKFNALCKDTLDDQKRVSYTHSVKWSDDNRATTQP